MHKASFPKYIISIDIWEMNNVLDILETARETVATRADAVPSRKPARPRPELIRPRLEIECIQYVIDAVRNYFE